MATTIPLRPATSPVYRRTYLHEAPAVRQIGVNDLVDAMKAGFADFMAMPSHLLFLAVIYPIAGVLAGYATVSTNLIPLLFPILAGFALLGPFVGLGLYEISRRRELGMPVSWANALAVFRGDAIRSSLILGGLLALLFVGWLFAANLIYARIFGPLAPASLSGFVSDLFGTIQGVQLIIVGHLVGLAFAVLALMLSVVSFPMLVDRRTSVGVAIQTSVRAVRANPVTMAIWGLIISGALMVGSAFLLVGLALVVPVLAHASWHLYRKIVVS